MPRPSVPLPKDLIAIAEGFAALGIKAGKVSCPDGTVVEWGDAPNAGDKVTPLEEWKAKRDAAS